MKILILALFFSSYAYAQNECNSLYQNRHVSKEKTKEAINCFKNLNSMTKLETSKKLNRISYLQFFLATYFEQNALDNLENSFKNAEDSIKQYGNLFDYNSANSQESSTLNEIALSYYLYGTSVSKYVDLKGKFEAIKRMGDIKNSMNLILRLKKEETFHYGAFRTLAIFYMKVPAIAGGSMAKSKNYFEKLMEKSKLESGLSSYPVNHILYAEYLYETGNKKSACEELKKVLNLTNSDLEKDYSSLKYETLKDQILASDTLGKYNC